MSLLYGILGLFYLTKILLLEPKDSHEGPFIQVGKHVIFPMPDHRVHVQRFSLFDQIRYWCGAYFRDGHKFFVRNDWRTELWTCPFCLSLWLAFLFTIPFIFTAQPNVIEAMYYHFAIAGGANLLLAVYERFL